MNTQLNIKISNNLLQKAEIIANDEGYLNVQEMIREILRNKIGHDKDGLFEASLESVGKGWFTKEEDRAWEKFQ